MATDDPLRSYLLVQKKYDKLLAKILLRAANDARRAILAQGASPSSKIRIGQLRIIESSLLAQSRALWAGVESVTAAGMKESAFAAQAVAYQEDLHLFRAAGRTDDFARYQATILLRTRDTVELYISGQRGFQSLNRPLAQSVYGSKNLADGLVRRRVANGILIGRSAREIAADVSNLIRPDVRGGVSYAAMRLGRTELNNAFHQSTIDRRYDEPWVESIKWNLSGSHPKPDQCNDFAAGGNVGRGGDGRYSVESVPGKPHPQCLCYLTTITIPPDEFVRRMRGGDFDSYMRNQETNG